MSPTLQSFNAVEAGPASEQNTAPGSGFLRRAGEEGKDGPGTGLVVHILPLRIYYEDTDAGGIVYFANYLKFGERARSEMLRCLGIDQSALRAETGALFVVRHVEADYRTPCVLDDRLEIRTRLAWIKKASMGLEQVIFRQDSNGEFVESVSSRVDVACINATGRPVRFPEAFQEKIAVLDVAATKV